MSKFDWTMFFRKILPLDNYSNANSNAAVETETSVEQLVPWYLNGTLGESEMNLINSQLDRSKQFSRDVELDLKIAGLLACEPPNLEQTIAQKEQGFAELIGAIRKHERHRTVRRSPLTLASISGVAAVFFTIAVIVSFTELGKYSGVDDGDLTDTYQTLTDPGSMSKGSVLQIVFESETPEREIRHLLLDRDAHLISGPTASGVYRVELPAAMDGESYVRELQANPAVRWVELEVR